MNNKETSYEQNLARLIQASCGEETRVTSSARHQLRQRLLAECRTRSAPDEFPKVVLSILTCVVLLLVVGGTLSGLGRVSLPADSAALSLLYVLVALNLLCIPAAGLIIILHRRWKSCLSV
jgi:hypothetical protein